MPSSVISRFHYYPDTSTLRIVFLSGMVYDYKNVPEKIYKELKTSSSKGSYLNQNIKPYYDYEKVN